MKVIKTFIETTVIFAHKSSVLLSSYQIMDIIEQAVSHAKQPSASGLNFSPRKLYEAMKNHHNMSSTKVLYFMELSRIKPLTVS